MKPTLTVVIPSFNHVAYVEQAIRSVFAQRNAHAYIELVVIDDASTDGSQALLKALQHELGFKLILNNTNKGLIPNLNRALRLSHGSYFAVLGSDDIWMQDKTRIQIDFLESNPQYAMVSANSVRIDSAGRELSVSKQRLFQEADYDFDDVLTRKIRVSTTANVVRRSALEAVGGFDDRYRIEDYSLWLKLTKAGFSIKHLPYVLAYYRLHGNNTIGKPVFIFDEMKKILSQYKTEPSYATGMKRLANVYFPQIARVDKRRALSMLPTALAPNRFFLSGLKHLLF